MNIIIRGLNDGDREAFIDLSCGLTKFNYYTRPESERNYSLEHRLSERINNCSKTFNEFLTCSTQRALIALLNEEPIGYATMYHYSDNSGLLDELYIAEGFRGLGVGKSLMEEATIWLRGVGASKMLINVYNWNKDAQGFYETDGFQKHIITYSKNL